MRRSYFWPALFFAVPLALGALLMNATYASARAEALDRLRFQARVLADQASRGIGEYFDYYYRSLGFLASLPEVASMEEDGISVLTTFLDSQGGNIRAVTRIDGEGRILWSLPDASVAGRDVSAQEHNARLLSTHKPTLSRVFDAVQGYRAIALAYPVFDADERFSGALTILIPFEQISRRYVEGIAIGDSGYAVLFDSDGTELYCPVPGHTGRNVRDTSASSPSMLALADRMALGESGDAAYDYDAIGPASVAPIEKLARFESIPLVDSFWTILVTAPESEAFEFLSGFRDRWTLLGIFLVALCVVWSVFMIRALERNRVANAALAASNVSLEAFTHDLRSTQERLVMSEKLAALGLVASGIGHQVNSPLGAIVSASGNVLEVAGRDLSPTLRSYAALRPELRLYFDSMLERASLAAADGRERESPSRAARLAAGKELAALGIEDASAIADDLADMGLLSERADYLPLLREPGGVALVAEAQRLSSLLVSARVIRDAAERAGGVVGALRTYARADRTRISRDVEVATEIDMALTIYAGTSKPGLIVLRRLGKDCVVRAVPDLLVQVWTNLIVNAVQAMDGNGTLEVSTERTGDRVVVLIGDTGPGIPKDFGDRVFEPFFTTKSAGEGSGLGLDIARRIVQELGGAISYESKPGRTVFRVELPAAAEAKPEGGI